MVIKPKIRGFICTNAHPVGCEASVLEQIEYVKSQGSVDCPKNVLVIGCSTGYGLASRITAAFGAGANTLGVCFEKEPSERKTATAGWYNTAAFHKAAKQANLYCKTLNGDAFSDAMKAQVIDLIKQDLGTVDAVIYSLASPRRTDPKTGETYNSQLKPIGKQYTTKTFDTSKEIVHEVTLDPATQDDIDNTVKVMGGEDWELWMQALSEAGVLAKGCTTTAYTYIGKELTWPIYGHATIGKAKEDLDRAAAMINQQYQELDVSAYVSSLKAVVTQASSAIPVMPLYISLMFKVMKEEGCHEGVIEQIYGLFNNLLFAQDPQLDEAKRLRMDTVETRDEIQEKIKQRWAVVNSENFSELGDYTGYHLDFLKLFGFGFESVDYEQDVSPLAEWV
ncbi:MAG: trans-2-enoyl-CoA reductase family protein [Gammaproteobacteria bacterium]|nr:trans-2-enoyl-CoA reductase family protein [Gammaproteobacteria bacterium]NVK89414.1 trans-2-enoyl-CoA reductase family protein [Gammaproteobacteria bacterium]